MKDFKFKKGDNCKIKEKGLWEFNKGEKVYVAVVDKNDYYQPYLVKSLDNSYAEWVEEEFLQRLNNSIKKLKES